jgi:UDP-glucose 4-epimerase
MDILFTGASSFTGYWFVKTLSEAGHNVYTTFTKNKPDDYEGIRKERVLRIVRISRPVFNCSFGDNNFLRLLESASGFDLLCHHAADVRNYKSFEFDVNSAIQNNTHNLSQTLDIINEGKIRGVILTGSVFEQNEGKGNKPLAAFSPYGFSKGLTWQIFEYYCRIKNVKLGKFVIPNPFGPFEEPRFTNYLVKNWFEDKTPGVNTPDYIRDNIHISLLAEVYNYFVSEFISSKKQIVKINPSGYTESQWKFTSRFAKELSKRLNIKCKFELNEQTDFSEPLKRINFNNAARIAKRWKESDAWDDAADYYCSLYRK